MSRHLIVIDIEATSLDTSEAIPVEVAYWDLHSGLRGRFIPPHDVGYVLRFGDPDSLTINGYRQRLADAQQGTWTDVREFRGLLDGQQIAGKNVAGYDWPILSRWLWPAADVDAPSVPHRMWDLGSYAAAVLGLSPSKKLPSLAEVCDLLGIDHGDHTATGDVTATGRCFLALLDKAGVEL